MSAIFCCSNISAYRPRRLDHDAKFRVFSDWASYPKSSSVVEDADDASTLDKSDGYFAMQVVQQVNFGPLESKRYFITAKGQDGEEPFVEVAERYLIDANYKKVNSYKNFKCATHNKFFELNLYQKNPENRHHWRADVARPAADIDL